jgi:hypothetical protein
MNAIKDLQKFKDEIELLDLSKKIDSINNLEFFKL